MKRPKYVVCRPQDTANEVLAMAVESFRVNSYGERSNRGEIVVFVLADGTTIYHRSSFFEATGPGASEWNARFSADAERRSELDHMSIERERERFAALSPSEQRKEAMADGWTGDDGDEWEGDAEARDKFSHESY